MKREEQNAPAATVIIGDSRRMDAIKDESIHLVITSPPYWQLKDYGNGNQIGFHHGYEEYINHLNLVWQECYRVLHPGCRLCVNIGDQFARSVYYGRYKIIPIREEIIRFCETVGFDYMGAIIWQKVTTCNTTGGATVMGSFPYPRNGIIKLDYEFILIFKKLGTPPRVSREIKERSRLTTEEWNEYFYGHWNFAGEKQDKHLAMFPEELPKRLIKMFSFVGDHVLDPFLGSGTTCLAAQKLGRHSTGYEINRDFLPVIREKLGAGTLFHNVRVLFQEPFETDFSKEIAKLPYVFKDPVKFDKKIDPNRLKFGSKINMEDQQHGTGRETYYTVKAILGGNLIKLHNDLTVRLMGVKPKRQRVRAASQFLREQILRKPVFLKYDEQKYDNGNHLLAYVYLKNKTFVNAHLLKRGLGEIDLEYPFRYALRFQKMLQGSHDKKI